MAKSNKSQRAHDKTPEHCLGALPLRSWLILRRTCHLKSQPDVRVRNCSWSFFPFISHVQYSRALHPEAAVSGMLQNNLPNPLPSCALEWEGRREGWTCWAFRPHTTRFQACEDKKETAEEINGPDPLILFNSNFLSWSLQACSEYASYRAVPQHKRCSLGFQKPELWNSAALENNKKSFLPLLSPHQRNA